MNIIIASVELTEQAASDILVTAIEGGSNYWASFDNVTRAKDAHPDLSESSIISATLIDRDPSEVRDRWHLDTDMVRKGVNALVKGDVQVGQPIIDQIRDEDIDADGADCIIQAACFGEIVYG